MLDPLIPIIPEKFAMRLANRIIQKLGTNPLQGLMHADHRRYLVLEAIRETLTIEPDK